MITLPAADVGAATAVVTTAYDSRGGVDFSVAGRTWALPMVFKPLELAGQAIGSVFLVPGAAVTALAWL
jgi:hypothetical protein